MTQPSWQSADPGHMWQGLTRQSASTRHTVPRVIDGRVGPGHDGGCGRGGGCGGGDGYGGGGGRDGGAAGAAIRGGAWR